MSDKLQFVDHFLGVSPKEALEHALPLNGGILLSWLLGRDQQYAKAVIGELDSDVWREKLHSVDDVTLEQLPEMGSKVKELEAAIDILRLRSSTKKDFLDAMIRVWLWRLQRRWIPLGFWPSADLAQNAMIQRQPIILPVRFDKRTGGRVDQTPPEMLLPFVEFVPHGLVAEGEQSLKISAKVEQGSSWAATFDASSAMTCATVVHERESLAHDDHFDLPLDGSWTCAYSSKAGGVLASYTEEVHVHLMRMRDFLEESVRPDRDHFLNSEQFIVFRLSGEEDQAPLQERWYAVNTRGPHRSLQFNHHFLDWFYGYGNRPSN